MYIRGGTCLITDFLLPYYLLPVTLLLTAGYFITCYLLPQYLLPYPLSLTTCHLIMSPYYLSSVPLSLISYVFITYALLPYSLSPAPLSLISRVFTTYYLLPYHLPLTLSLIACHRRVLCGWERFCLLRPVAVEMASFMRDKAEQQRVKQSHRKHAELELV